MQKLGALLLTITGLTAFFVVSAPAHAQWVPDGIMTYNPAADTSFVSDNKSHVTLGPPPTASPFTMDVKCDTTGTDKSGLMGDIAIQNSVQPNTTNPGMSKAYGSRTYVQKYKWIGSGSPSPSLIIPISGGVDGTAAKTDNGQCASDSSNGISGTGGYGFANAPGTNPFYNTPIPANATVTFTIAHGVTEVSESFVLSVEAAGQGSHPATWTATAHTSLTITNPVSGN